MNFVVRLILLAQLWIIREVSSEEGMLRGNRELIEMYDNNSTDIHHHASHLAAGSMKQRIIGGSKVCLEVSIPISLCSFDFGSGLWVH